MDPAAPPQGVPAPPPRRMEGFALIGLIALAATGAIVAALYRGPEFDEFWTLAISDPHVPLDWQFSNMWMRDAHPPLFALGARIVQSFAGESYVALRLFNLLPLFAFLGVLTASWICAPRAKGFLLGFALLWISSLFFGYFALARSYFIMHAAIAAFMMGAIVVLAWPPNSAQHRKRLMAAAVVGLFTAVNINFLAAAILGPFLVLYIWLAWRQRRERLALAFFAGGVLAYLPLVSTTLIQFGFMVKYAANDNWVEAQSIPQALGEYARLMWRGAGQNLPIILTTLVYASAAFAAMVRKAKPTVGKDTTSSVLIAMALVWAISSVALLAVDQLKPFIVGPYLLTLSTALNGILALTVARIVFQRRALFWVAFVIAAGVTGVGLFQKSAEQNWFGTIRAIESELRKCPGAPVWFATWPRQKRPELEEGIFPIAYRAAARVGGFETNLRNASDTPLPSVAPACGFIWIEHMPSDAIAELSAAELLQTIKLEAPLEARISVLTRADSGVVLKIEAPG